MRKGEPIIRVGVLQNQEIIEITPLDDFRLIDARGKSFLTGKGQEIWRIRAGKTTTAAKMYRLLITTTGNKNEANQLASQFRSQRVYVKIQHDRSGSDDDQYRLFIAKTFKSKESALQFQQSINSISTTTIVDDSENQQGVELIIQHVSSGRELAAVAPVRLLNSRVIVNQVNVGHGFHWEHAENQVYRPELEFIVDQQLKITMVNILPMETYLYGVVSKEMNPAFPLEVLKAQAIAARSIAVTQKGKRHPGAAFDFCGTVHCQVYGGFGAEDERSTRAITATRGMVITLDKVLDAPYHAVCGGHTENAGNVWTGANPEYLMGKFDVDINPKRLSSFDLRQEENARAWILSSPKVNCNLEDQDSLPELNYAKKYFRWQERIKREELEHIILEKSGVNIGTLLELKPLERGVSGRIKKLEIRGTKEIIIVEKELEIRRVLSKNHLFSACFIVDVDIGSEHLPSVFTITGAGWGHGVGMCQIGACMLAHKGWTAQQILSFYYPGTKILHQYE